VAKSKIAERYVRMWPRDLFHIQTNDSQETLKSKLKEPGIYILYRDSTPYYVGKADNLYRRLSEHSDVDSMYGNFWNMFSVFVVPEPEFRNQLEAILIAAMPTVNRMHPKHFERIHLPTALKKIYYGKYEASAAKTKGTKS
jgi:excinuclease UvrABC nuclease subunit